LSIECRALTKDFNLVAASCAEAAREVNRREKADEQGKSEALARMPNVQLCLLRA